MFKTISYKIGIFILLFFNIYLQANTKVSLQLNWKHQFQFAGFYMAKEMGFYKDAGIDLTIKEYDKNTKLIDLVTNHDVDFIIGPSSSIIDKINGKDIVALGAIFQSSPLMLLVRENSGIKTVKDLKNKKIMLSHDEKNSASILAMLEANGLNKKNTKIVPHSFNLQDLIDNTVDAQAAYLSNEPIILEKKNIKYKIFHPQEFGFDSYSDIILTSSHFIKNNPQLTKEFYDATLKGWEYAFANISKTSELIFKKYNTQQKSLLSYIKEGEILQKMTYSHGETFFGFEIHHPLGHLHKDKLRNLVSVYKVLGLIHTDLNMHEFIYEYNHPKIFHFTLKEFIFIFIFILIVFFIILHFSKNRKYVFKKNELQKIIQEAPTPIMIYNEDGEILFVNTIWKKLTQYDFTSIETVEQWSEKAHGHKNITSKINIISSYDAGKRVDYGEFSIKTNNNDILNWQMSSAPFGIINHKKVIITTAMDVTELKEKSLLLYQQSKLTAMGEMIRNIAHQWRQPLSSLNGIFLNIELDFTNNKLDSKVLDNYLLKMEDITQYLSNTINDFSTYFCTPKKKEQFDVKDIVLKSHSMINQSLKDKNINCILAIEKSFLINSYPSELMQVIFSLINNAKDAFANKEIKNKNITILLYQIEKTLLLEIKDNAGGIQKEIIDNIFEPYFTTKYKSKGTGLGLFIAKSIVEKSLKAELLVENTQDGVSFTIQMDIK